ncbi:MAG: hypothetical protein IBX56_11525 [Methylomicrobium sp.]|nr:hypothetical protein [Methylomicrobium sp.]
MLRRYGVVFRKVLERENDLPSWRERLYVFRRILYRDGVPAREKSIFWKTSNRKTNGSSRMPYCAGAREI